MSSDKPLLLIISSPSGAGKTTLTARLLAEVKGLTFSISHTTRNRARTRRTARSTTSFRAPSSSA